MAEIVKEIKFPANDLVLEILKRQKGEDWRDKNAIINFEPGFDFDKRFTPNELEELGWWLIHEAQNLKKKNKVSA